MGMMVDMVTKVSCKGQDAEGRPRKFIARMSINRLKQTDTVPSVGSQEMDTFAKDSWTNSNRKQITEDILEWMCELGSDSYRHLVLMMDLMDVMVKERMV